MRQLLIVITVAFFTVCPAYGKVKFGVRAGMDMTSLKSYDDALDSSNRRGFFLGPTMKVGLPLGIDIDASLLYNQMDIEPGMYVVQQDDFVKAEMRRSTIDIPLNIRKGFGFGDVASVFIFGGPQFSLDVGHRVPGDVEAVWSNRDLSFNIGAGVMLVNHLEVKVNYNVALNDSDEFIDALKHSISDNSNTWQVGLAIYF